MELTVTISPTAEREFGTGIQQKIQDLIEKEAIRLGHIRRSQPKTPITPINLEAKQIGESLLKIYQKKRERYGDSYPQRFIQQEQEVISAMQSGDISTLKAFLIAQAWQEKA